MKDALRGASWRERLRRVLVYLWIGAVNPGPPPLPKPCGSAWYRRGGEAFRCQREAGHEGSHFAPSFGWWPRSEDR